jgi:hypothetical protein
MDIAGAKALKDRLGAKGAEGSPSAADVDVPEDAPPVYHWLGVAGNAPRDAEDDGPSIPGASLLQRLGLNFR